MTTELGRGYLFTGFPWVLLGYSQATVLPVAQLASVTGVYGLSALVVARERGARARRVDRGRAALVGGGGRGDGGGGDGRLAGASGSRTTG